MFLSYIGSNDVDLELLRFGIFMILPGCGIDDVGVLLIELPRFVCGLSMFETPLSRKSDWISWLPATTGVLILGIDSFPLNLCPEV